MKKAILVFVAAASVFALVSCGGENIKPTGNKVVDELNTKLSTVSITGFPSGKESSNASWDMKLTIAIPVVKEVIPRVPGGWVLQVTGHSDAEGGITAPDNYRLSAARARMVFDRLRAKGVWDPKVTQKGVAGTMMSGKCGKMGDCQRRVSFRIVPK
jgi:outer membrane protein OmpA-like peptidoglycan-associated protein